MSDFFDLDNSGIDTQIAINRALKIKTTGNGENFLSDDGEYKSIDVTALNNAIANATYAGNYALTQGDTVKNNSESGVYDGDDGREIELQKTTTYVQWRYQGDVSWKNLVSLSEIKGNNGADGTNGINGDDVELRNSGTYIQLRYYNSSTDTYTDWENLIPLSDMEGYKKGDKIELQKSDTHIQYRHYDYDTQTSSDWENLVPLSDLKGDQGDSTVWVDSSPPPENYDVWIDPNGDEHLPYGQTKGYVFIAASDATAEEQARADFICDGVNDSDILKEAYTFAAEQKKDLYLSSGTFFINKQVSLEHTYGQTSFIGRGKDLTFLKGTQSLFFPYNNPGNSIACITFNIIVAVYNTTVSDVIFTKAPHVQGTTVLRTQFMCDLEGTITLNWEDVLYVGCVFKKISIILVMGSKNKTRENFFKWNTAEHALGEEGRIPSGLQGGIDSVYIAASNAPADEKMLADFVCHGTNDSTQLALALSHLKVGGAIHLSSGTFNLTETLIINKACTIVGQGRDKTFIQGSYEDPEEYDTFVLQFLHPNTEKVTLKGVHAIHTVSGTGHVFGGGSATDGTIEFIDCYVHNVWNVLGDFGGELILDHSTCTALTSPTTETLTLKNSAVQAVDAEYGRCKCIDSTITNAFNFYSGVRLLLLGNRLEGVLYVPLGYKMFPSNEDDIVAANEIDPNDIVWAE